MAVGGRGRVDDQRAAVADIGEMAEEKNALDQSDAGRVATLEPEGEDGAGPAGQVLLRQPMERAGGLSPIS